MLVQTREDKCVYTHTPVKNTTEKIKRASTRKKRLIGSMVCDALLELPREEEPREE